MNKKNQRGFALLLEMLIVLVIVLILAAGIVPSLVSASQMKTEGNVEATLQNVTNAELKSFTTNLAALGVENGSYDYSINGNASAWSVFAVPSSTTKGRLGFCSGNVVPATVGQVQQFPLSEQNLSNVNGPCASPMQLMAASAAIQGPAGAQGIPQPPEQVRAGRPSTGAARSATTERTGTSQPGTARSSAGAAGSPGSSNAGRASEGPDPKEVARRADLKIRRFVGLVKSNGRLALLLVGLGWLSVALRSFGMVTVFEPRDAQGNLIFGGLPDLPAPNVSLMINCLLIGFVASVVLGPVWRGLDRRGRLVMAGGIELILLAIAGIDQGTGLSLLVLGLVIASVGGLFAHHHLSSKRARRRSVVKVDSSAP